MIAITHSERIAEAEAGFNVVLGLLITGKATLPDPTFRTRLQMRSFTRDDFRHLYGQEMGGSPDPEYSLLFQSCINARYFTVVNWPGAEIVMMSEDLICSYLNGTLCLGLFGAAAFPPWIRSKLVHLHLSRDQGSGFRLSIPSEAQGRKLILDIHYIGDAARLYVGHKLYDDNFYNGDPFSIALWRIPAAEWPAIQLKVLPYSDGLWGRLPQPARDLVRQAQKDSALNQITLVAKNRLEVKIMPP